MEELDKNLMRDIKTQFYALRNGAIAERLRTAGSPYKIIFGLMLPQIERSLLAMSRQRNWRICYGQILRRGRVG